MTINLIDIFRLLWNSVVNVFVGGSACFLGISSISSGFIVIFIVIVIAVVLFLSLLLWYILVCWPCCCQYQRTWCKNYNVCWCFAKKCVSNNINPRMRFFDVFLPPKRTGNEEARSCLKWKNVEFLKIPLQRNRKTRIDRWVLRFSEVSIILRIFFHNSTKVEILHWLNVEKDPCIWFLSMLEVISSLPIRSKIFQINFSSWVKLELLQARRGGCERLGRSQHLARCFSISMVAFNWFGILSDPIGMSFLDKHFKG